MSVLEYRAQDVPVVDPTILAVYGPVPAGVDLGEDHRAANDAVVGLLLLVATVALLLRLACRRMNNTGLRADDWSMVAALFFTYGSGALSVTAARFGAGRHVWAVTAHEVVTAGELNYIHSFIFSVSVTLTKISVLLLYARIFGINQGNFRINLWLTALVTVSYPVTVFVGMLAACQPISHFWTRLAEVSDDGTGNGGGRCVLNTRLFYMVLGIVNLVLNVWILIIPIPQILKLQMSRRNKAAVCGLMLLGGFACVASVVRIYYLFVYAYDTDVAWYMGPVGLWSSAEPSIGIWAACMSVMRPLYRKFWNKVKPHSSGGRAVTLRSQYLCNPSHAETSSATFGTSKMSDKHYLKYDDVDTELTNMDHRWLGSKVVSGGALSEDNRCEGLGKGIMVQTEVRLERVED